MKFQKILELKSICIYVCSLKDCHEVKQADTYQYETLISKHNNFKDARVYTVYPCITSVTQLWLHYT